MPLNIIFAPMRYATEIRAALAPAAHAHKTHAHKKTGRDAPGFRCYAKNGGAKRDRTVDLNAASVALSQLSYGPAIPERATRASSELAAHSAMAETACQHES